MNLEENILNVVHVQDMDIMSDIETMLWQLGICTDLQQQLM
jgi:hypothetical protein